MRREEGGVGAGIHTRRSAYVHMHRTSIQPVDFRAQDRRCRGETHTGSAPTLSAGFMSRGSPGPGPRRRLARPSIPVSRSDRRIESLCPHLLLLLLHLVAQQSRAALRVHVAIRHAARTCATASQHITSHHTIPIPSRVAEAAIPAPGSLVRHVLCQSTPRIALSSRNGLGLAEQRGGYAPRRPCILGPAARRNVNRDKDLSLHPPEMAFVGMHACMIEQLHRSGGDV